MGIGIRRFCPGKMGFNYEVGFEKKNELGNGIGTPLKRFEFDLKA